MLHYDPPFSWFETPRMRWRAYGIGRFLSESAVSMGTAALLLVLIGPLLALRLTYPSWRIALFVAGAGAFLGLFMQLFPKPVGLREGRLAYGSGNLADYWPIKRCRVLGITAVRGVLRIELEVPLRNDKPAGNTTVVILARPKHTEQIRRAFEAGGATFSPSAAAVAEK